MSAPTTRRGGPTFVKLANALTFDPDLSDGALRAYMALVAYARIEGATTFELSGTELGALLSRSDDQAARRIKELEAHKLVAVQRLRGYGLRNVYTVLDPQGVAFGDEVGRRFAEPRSRTSADAWFRTSAEPRYIGEREGERENPSARPVDNAGAPRPALVPEVCEHGGRAGLRDDGDPWCPQCRRPKGPRF